jgi:hypothetical protein
MAEDQPGLPGSGNGRDDRPSQRPTEPLGEPAPAPPPSYDQPAGALQPPASTPPVAWGQYPPPMPAPAAAGPSPEALAGFWRRLVAAFLDWILVGIVASAIGALFGVDTTSPAPAPGDGFQFRLDWAGPYILVELAYFTYFMPPARDSRSATRSWGSGCWTPIPAGPCPMPGRLSAR